MDAHDPQRQLEDLREENLRLRSGLEQALLFAEEVATGAHEQSEAEAMVAVLRDVIEGSRRR